MKDAAITVRVPAETRRRLESLARHEGRSLSQQVERLILQGLAARSDQRPPGARALSGVFAGGEALAPRDFRNVRASVSASLRRPRRV